MAGSLYLSEVAHYPPCVLCWYQRICMYPLALILLIAAIRRRRDVAMYAIPLAGIGAAISTYHYLHERFPDSVASTCSTEVPCSYTWIWQLHYISIPMMALTTMALIAVLVGIARADGERTEVAHTSAAGTDEVSKSSTPERTSP